MNWYGRQLALVLDSWVGCCCNEGDTSHVSLPSDKTLFFIRCSRVYQVLKDLQEKFVFFPPSVWSHKPERFTLFFPLPLPWYLISHHVFSVLAFKYLLKLFSPLYPYCYCLVCVFITFYLKNCNSLVDFPVSSIFHIAVKVIVLKNKSVVSYFL